VVPKEWHQSIIIPLYKGNDPNRSVVIKRHNAALRARQAVCTRHSCENKTNPAAAQTSSTERVYTNQLVQRVIVQLPRATLHSGDRILDIQRLQHMLFGYIKDRAAFEMNRPALWQLLRFGIPDKIVRLFRALYDHSVSCFRTGGIQSPWFNIESGIRQGCVFAPDSFATGIDWLLEKTVGSGATSVSFGQALFTDLDFADDVSLLAQLLELLVPALELMADEAASLGLEVNWQETKIHALGRTEGVPLTVTVKKSRCRGVCLSPLSHSFVSPIHP